MPNKKCVEFYPKLRFLIFGNIHKSLTLQVGIGNIYIYIYGPFLEPQSLMELIKMCLL